jgi:hypothetical protein
MPGAIDVAKVAHTVDRGDLLGLEIADAEAAA